MKSKLLIPLVSLSLVFTSCTVTDKLPTNTVTPSESTNEYVPPSNNNESTPSNSVSTTPSDSSVPSSPSVPVSPSDSSVPSSPSVPISPSDSSVPSSPSDSSVPNIGGITTSKTNLIGQLNQTYEINVENTTNEALFVLVNDNKYDYVTANLSSANTVSVKLLKEGDSSITIKTASNAGVTIQLTAIDLKITNTEDYIAKGTSLQINLSSAVDAQYSTSDSNIATVSASGLVTTHKEGVFDLTVTYGDIVLTKSFDSNLRVSEIKDFNRNSSHIRYYGRNVHQGDKVLMNNTASGFEVTFFGTKLEADLDAMYATYYGRTQISVLVDGETDTTKRIIKLDKSAYKARYTIVDGLQLGVHTVKVLKRTEALSTSMSLYSLKTDGYFKPVDKTEKLKIEAFGDSITAGFGNLRPSSNPDFTDSNSQNGLQTYATYTAAALNAEINVQARSGIGMFTSGNVDTHVNTLYNKVNYDGVYNWNLNNYTPDILIINLGTNDFWDWTNYPDGGPDPVVFKNEYVKTVSALLDVYGEDTSIILASGLMENNVNQYLPAIKETLNAKYSNDIHIIQFSQVVYGHPLASEHKTASEQLVKYIKDNNLDVIHTKQPDATPTVGEASNKQVNAKINVELQDEIFGDLYLKGLNDQAIKLEKTGTFTYSTTQSIKEGDYTLAFNINNDDKYKEYNSSHVVKVRENNANFNLILDSFIDMPEKDFSETYGYRLENHLFPAYLTATSASSISLKNKDNWLAAFVSKKTTYQDNFKLSANISAPTTPTNNTAVGLCPYYQDDLNYMLVYFTYSEEYSIYSVVVRTVVNGTDYGATDLGIRLSTYSNLEVTKNGALYKVSAGGQEKTFSNYNAAGESKHFALYNSGIDHAIDYTNITQTTATATTANYGWHQTACLNPQTVTYVSETSVSMSNNNTLVKPEDNSNWLAGMVVRDCQYDDNYTVSAKITGSQDGFPGADCQIALVPYYEDASNFVVVYLQWANANNTINSIGMTGMINGTWINWNDFWNFGNLTTSLSDGDVLTVTRKGSTITVAYGGVTQSNSVAGLANRNNGACGVWSHNGGTITFSEYSVVAAN